MGIRLMEMLFVDAVGKVTIPSHILEKRGLHPDDELVLVEVNAKIELTLLALDSYDS